MMLKEAANLTIDDNSFSNNRHDEGATIFWLYLDVVDTTKIAMLPQMSYSGNVFSNNLARGKLEYNNITTEIMGTTTSPERLIVTNYAEGVRDLLVNISAVDYYKNVVASTSTRVQISVDSSQESCLF